MASQRKDAAVAKSSKPVATTASSISVATTSTTSAASLASTATSAAASATNSATTAASSLSSAATVATTTASTVSTKTSRASERGKATTSATTATTMATSGSTSTGSNASNTTTNSAATTIGSSSSGGASAATTTTALAPATTLATTTSTSATSASATTTKPLAAATATGASSTTSSPTENVPPADLSQCALCGGECSNSPDDTMACLSCGSAFHPRCANLPQTPEEGDTFCRWECFSAYRKRQGVAPRTPLGDFSKLAARTQSILVNNGQLAPDSSSAPTPSYGRDNDPQPHPRLRERSKRGLRGPSGARSRSPSPYYGHNDGSEQVSPGPPPHNGYGIERRLPDEMGPGPRRPSPRGRSPAQSRQYSPSIDLTADDVNMPLPRSPRSRPAARGAGGRVPIDDIPFDEAEELRSKRQKYLAHVDSMSNGARTASRRDSYPQPSSRRQHSPLGNGAGGYQNDIPPHFVASGGSTTTIDGAKGGDPRLGFSPGPYDHRRLPPPPGIAGRGPMMAMQGPGSLRMPPPAEEEIGSRPSSGRSARSGNGGARYSDRLDEYEGRGPPPGPPRSRPSSADRAGEGSGGRRDRVPADGPPANRHMQPAMPPGRFNIPWLNPAAFPAGLYERFKCRRDDPNGVFRIDLTPVFADKTMHLYQSEIDFFFRCFESADVSLVVKGMASELNQYIWAWPFILESCGSETHFSFDHFQFRHNAGEVPELEYVGELRLSMAAYNAYLERYLSGSSMANDVVVLEDHATKKPITLVAGDNIIALNDLVIAEHCAQLHNDLIKSFQWDVFAGGIHCLLQYLPQANRHKRFASPLLHFNFPGARGRLRDPGNGTTDTAYQVLTGSLELVIFERLEPKDRDTFLRVLRAAGYDPNKKTMLLDSHLRILRDSGFAWSTVLLNGGEFVHVNKGRLHFWRVVETEGVRGPIVNAPCVFLSWEWVYQGVSQRGISTECWFAMKNASLCTGGWAFDPRRTIVEAAKCGVAIVRTGQFLNSLSGPGAPPVLMQLAFTGASPASIDREVVSQRQEQMVLFLESILPCMDAIVEEEFELGLVKDDSDDFRKIFDDEVMWKVVDTALSVRAAPRDTDYECGICGLELTNIYKQCLGCTVHARRRRPNASYPVFRICVRCHAQPERHHYKPRALHGFYDKLCSSEGHTGLLPATRRYQSERSYFKCRCAPYVRCSDCGGCESCCCLCHTLFQTRFRFTAPEHLDHLRTDVVDVIKWHKQQQAPPPHLQRPHPHAQR